LEENYLKPTPETLGTSASTYIPVVPVRSSLCESREVAGDGLLLIIDLADDTVRVEKSGRVRLPLVIVLSERPMPITRIHQELDLYTGWAVALDLDLLTSQSTLSCHPSSIHLVLLSVFLDGSVAFTIALENLKVPSLVFTVDFGPVEAQVCGTIEGVVVVYGVVVGSVYSPLLSVAHVKLRHVQLVAVVVRARLT
jgi:hypothetical protein